MSIFSALTLLPDSATLQSVSVGKRPFFTQQPHVFNYPYLSPISPSVDFPLKTSSGKYKLLSNEVFGLA